MLGRGDKQTIGLLNFDVFILQLANISYVVNIVYMEPERYFGKVFLSEDNCLWQREIIYLYV